MTKMAGSANSPNTSGTPLVLRYLTPRRQLLEPVSDAESGSKLDFQPLSLGHPHLEDVAPWHVEDANIGHTDRAQLVQRA